MNNHEDCYDLPDEDRIPFDENDDYAYRLDDQDDDIDYYFRHDQTEEELKKLDVSEEQDLLKEDLNRLEGEGGKVINGPNK